MIRSSSSTPNPSRSGITDLTALLSLEEIDTNLFRSQLHDTNQRHSLFGGQLLGQACMAATLTAPPGRQANSLHARFLRAGSDDHPMIYQVERTRDGASFSSRRVTALQNSRTIFHMEISFHKQETGFDHETKLAMDVPPPEKLLNLPEISRHYGDRLTEHARARLLVAKPALDMRPIEPENFFLRKAPQAKGRLWVRVAHPLPDDPALHRAALAYLSDYMMAGISVISHAESVISREFFSTSLDHALWFHRDVRADDWLLYDMESPISQGSRGFIRGQLYTRDGRMVASTAQEALQRPMGK